MLSVRPNRQHNVTNDRSDLNGTLQNNNSNLHSPVSHRDLFTVVVVSAFLPESINFFWKIILEIHQESKSACLGGASRCVGGASWCGRSNSVCGRSKSVCGRNLWNFPVAVCN